MEEKVLEVTYIINGEKYLITAVKVNDDETQIPTEETVLEELVPEEDENPKYATVNISDIPDGMDIDTWLNIINEFGIVLVK